MTPAVRAMIWVGVTVTCLVGVGVGIAFDQVVALTAQATTGRASVWVLTPYVAPGDPLALSVTSAGRLTEVRVERDGREVARWDAGPAGSAELTVVTPDRPGPAELIVHADWMPEDSRFAPPRWLRGERAERLALQVEVRSRPAVIALRLGNLALAGLFWIQAVVGLAWLVPRMHALDRQPDGNLTEAVAGALCCALVIYALAGYWLFAQPITAATGWTGTLTTFVALAVWTVGAIFAGFRLSRAWTARRHHALTLDQPADPAVVAERLRARGLNARALLGRLWVRDAGGAWLWASGLGAGGTVQPVTDAEHLVLQLALALSAPSTVGNDGLWVRVGPDSTLEGLQAELAARREEMAREILARLEAFGSFEDIFRRTLS